jgi:hypothetical protein
MTMLRLCLIFISWLALVGCNGQGSEDTSTKDISLNQGQKNQIPIRTFPLKLQDSVAIPLGPEHTLEMLTASLLGDTLLFYNSRKSPHVIQRANLAQHQMEPPIKIDPNFIRWPSCLYPHTRDSIFVTNEYPPSLHLINSRGDIVQKWAMGDAPVAWSSPLAERQPEYKFTHHHLVIKRYDPANCHIYLQLSQAAFWYYGHKEENYDQAVYDLCAKKWVRLYGHTPPFYLTEGDWEYPNFLTMPSAVEKGDTTFLAHPISHEVALLSSQSGKLLALQTLSSPAMSKPAPLYSKEERTAKGVVAENEALNYSRYGFLLYLARPQMLIREVVSQVDPANQAADPKENLSRTLTYACFNTRGEKVYDLVSIKTNPYRLLPVASQNFVLATRRKRFLTSDDTLYLYRYYPTLR